LRVTGRLFWLGGEMFLAALNYGLHCAFCPLDSLPSARAAWLQNSSRRVLRVFRIENQFTGNIPSDGLLVCNHLRYLDILPVSAAVIQYALGDGDVGGEVCYWKDMTLVPHLINLCSKRAIQASVHFSQLREGNEDRKQLARKLHAEVLRMKHAFSV